MSELTPERRAAWNRLTSEQRLAAFAEAVRLSPDEAIAGFIHGLRAALPAVAEVARELLVRARDGQP